MPPQRRGYVRCLLAAVCFGVSAPAASRLTEHLNAFALAGLLYLGAALAMVPATIRTPPAGATLRHGAGRLATAVLLGGGLGPVLLALGLARTSAASGSLLLNLELVFTTVIAGVVFREHIGARVAAGTLLVAIAGAILAGWSGLDAQLGALLIAGACVCWAIDNSVTAALDELAPAYITFVKGAVAGSVNLALGALVGGIDVSWHVVWALAVGAVGYGISITLWVAGARDVGAARGQLVFATAPFVGALVAWVLLGDPVVGRELAAVVIAASGVALAVASSHEHAHAHDGTEHEHEHTHDDGHHDHRHKAGESARHTHRHTHEPVRHAHPHVPDLHHRHTHT